MPYADADTTSSQDVRRRPAAAPAANTTDGAPVALSALSNSLAKPDGDIDMARVEALREAIRNGELRIDASRIADGLIDSVRELTQ
ncbi:flagellar biosynthesis anti-sigma factor FlgM [Achromobacter sp. GG226]|nr:flagellar biosynthesis anti-sigma factor FlgM [Verticiella sp. GG226]